MSQIFWCEVSRLRRSVYNPRIVQDPEKTRILKASIAREGVKQPLIVYDAGDGFFEVLDGGRRLAAAAELEVERLPCVVIPAVDIPKQSLTIHFSQDDLTPEEVVVLVERLVGEEVFKSVEDVCRYLGVSKSWYYTLKKAVKRPENVEGLPVTTLELIERTGLEESKKQELAELLRSTRLPRDVVREVVKEVEENPGEAAAIVGKHLLSMPRQLGDNAVEASGKYTYIIRLEASTAEFTARNQGQTLWTVRIPLQDLRIVKRLWQQV
jgi:hypothetical protein